MLIETLRFINRLLYCLLHSFSAFQKRSTSYIRYTTSASSTLAGAREALKGKSRKNDGGQETGQSEDNCSDVVPQSRCDSIRAPFS